MNKTVEKIKAKFEENPVETIAIGAFAATAAAKLISAVNGSANARTWKKEVNRRTKMTR